MGGRRGKIGAAIVIVVLVAIFLAYRYHHVGALGGHQSHRIAFSPSEADARISAANARLKDSPEDLDALTQLAIAYYAKGPESYVDAMNALEKARTLGATNESLFFYAGVMYDALGLPDYAINEFKKYLRHFPRDYEALVRLGNLYFRDGQDSDAARVYQEAIALWPKDPTVLFNNAVVSVHNGDLATAQKMLDQVQALTGALPVGGLFVKGEIERVKGSTETAVPLYQQEIAKSPDYLPALQALEAALRQKSDWKDAKALRIKIEQLKAAAHG